MNRLAALLLLMGAMAGPAFSQLACDPNDRVYTDLKLWEDRGIIRHLPPLRPYPVQLLRTLLTEVEQRGDANDAAAAGAYLGRETGLLAFHAETAAEARGTARDPYGEMSLRGTFQGCLDPLVTYSGFLGAVIANGSRDSALPEYQRPTVDYITDASVRPLGSTGLVPHVSSASSAAIGTDSFYFQAGDTRGSFGPFWGDNAVLSPDSPQAGQFSYVYRHPSFTVTEMVMALSAMDSSGRYGPSPGKFLALHSLEIYPLTWLTLGVFESIVWGPRFELLYLLPFCTYFYTQGFVGYPDNSFLGIDAGVRLPGAVRADFVLYIDDAEFNDLVRGNFDTKLKLAAQAGLSWTPHLPLLARLELNVLAITPYTYTHTNTRGDLPGDPNYLDYTNAGQDIGPSLSPDSARVEIQALLRPLPFLDVAPFGRIILHGNASQGLYAGAGTIFDSGFSQDAYSRLRFLTQSTIEKTIQAGLRLSARLDAPTTSATVSLAWTIECVLNAGAVAHRNALNNYLGARLQCLF